MTYPYRHIAVLSHCARCRKRLHIGRAFFVVRRDLDAGGNETVTVLTVGWALAHQSTTENEENGGLKPILRNYLSDFLRLQSRHNIWQFSSIVFPPLHHGVM